VDNAFFLVDLGFAFMLMLALAQGTTWPMTGDRSPVSDCECV
jgi:hypothetical protein